MPNHISIRPMAKKGYAECFFAKNRGPEDNVLDREPDKLWLMLLVKIQRVLLSFPFLLRFASFYSMLELYLCECRLICGKLSPKRQSAEVIVNVEGSK